ncbi:MAG: SNF2-related protein [Desulfuromonadales bacterium]
MPITVTTNRDTPFLFDREGLESFASKQVVSEGLRYFKEQRVMEIDQDRERLWGQVEDAELDAPCAVEITAGVDGVLRLGCDCSDIQETLCRHQVAVLFAYADQLESGGQLFSATETAVKDRVKRGRSEVVVDHLSGESWFGTWQAASVSSTTHFPRQYRVCIRSLHRRANVCNCPDFLINQLGTCKHIEAVLHKICKHHDFRTIKNQPPPISYIFLAWDIADAPQVCLHRRGDLAADLQGVLADYFATDGRFTGRLPDDFFRLTELVEGRSDLDIGVDAGDYVRQLAADAAHRLRAERIRAEILAGGGRLAGLKARLYPYQVEGVAFLAGTGRALLADDMGLGKTLQALAAAGWLREREGVRKILIICPASLKQQWAREIERFTDLESQIIQGPAPVRGAQYRRDVTFFIINYELVLRDLTLLKEKYCPDLIIMDEAQRIKNWRTKIAAAVKMIPSRYAFILSGTPLENRLEDLYSLMQVVNPRVLGPLWRYLVDFHITDVHGKVLGYRNLSLLRLRLKPVMLRRDRRLVKEQLPGRIVQRLDVALTAKQRDLHDAAMSAAGSLAAIARKRPLTPSEQNRLLASLQQARMACNAAGLVDKETSGSPKLDELVNILDELCLQSGLKAVVFSQWEQMTRMVELRLTRLGLGCVRLHGGVPTAKRGSLLDRFRDDDLIQVFISTDAGGVGLNLQSGSVLINLDVPWNPAVLEQRNARIHRLGQTRTVQIITMVASDSYEEQVFSLVRNKQHLFDNVIGEDASEDVVGVSKKLLETLVDDLAAERFPQRTEEVETVDSPVAEQASVVVASPGPPPDTAEDPMEQAITHCIEELQRTFGARIERIFGSGGGLVVVLDRVDLEADRLAERLSQGVPVALIDRLALKGLQRLGDHSPLAQIRSIYDGTSAPGTGGPSLLQRQAREKLKAARVLIEQQLPVGAIELLVAALLSTAADRAGRDMPLTRENVGVWAFTEALPQGILSQQEITLLMRAITLSQGAQVPEPLLLELALDAEGFVTGEE